MCSKERRPRHRRCTWQGWTGADPAHLALYFSAHLALYILPTLGDVCPCLHHVLQQVLESVLAGTRPQQAQVHDPPEATSSPAAMTGLSERGCAGWATGLLAHPPPLHAKAQRLLGRPSLIDHTCAPLAPTFSTAVWVHRASWRDSERGDFFRQAQYPGLVFSSQVSLKGAVETPGWGPGACCQCKVCTWRTCCIRVCPRSHPRVWCPHSSHSFLPPTPHSLGLPKQAATST